MPSRYRHKRFSFLNVFAYSFLFLLLACLLRPGPGQAAPPIPEHGFLETSSAILYDLDHDAILFEQNADQRIAPASLTKVLSMFLALDSVDQGKLSLDNTVTVSRAAAGTGGSRMGLRENDVVSLEQLLMGMAVSSGNDASMAVAECVGGSTPAFVAMMNAKAQALGMRDSQFRNPHGLPAKDQYTTARDMLTLARAYLQAHPQALRFHNTHTISHKGRVTWNKNPLLGQYPGADGLKTGWVNASGYNLIFTGPDACWPSFWARPTRARAGLRRFACWMPDFRYAATMPHRWWQPWIACPRNAITPTCARQPARPGVCMQAAMPHLAKT